MTNGTFCSDDVSQFMLEKGFIKSDKKFPVFQDKTAMALLTDRQDDNAVLWRIAPCKFWQIDRTLSSGEEKFINDWTFEWMDFLAQKHGKDYVDYLTSYLSTLQKDYREIQSRIMSARSERELRTLPICVEIKQLESCPNIGSTDDTYEAVEDFSGHKQRFDIKVYRYMEMIWNKIKYLEKQYAKTQDPSQQM